MKFAGQVESNNRLVRNSEITASSLAEHGHETSTVLKNSIDKLMSTALQTRFSKIVSGFEEGYLRVQWPDGSITEHGEDNPVGEPVEVILHDYDPIKRMALNGSIGWAESYMDGHWSTNDIFELFMLFLKNEHRFPSAVRGSWFAKLGNTLLHRWNKNTLSGSKKNIARHYDLGNDFYRIWLDGSMSYSSGVYNSEDDSLEQAQKNKIQMVLDAVDSKPGDRVLEIGCGWGAMANALTSRNNCEVTGISLSKEQLQYANENLLPAPHADNAKASGGELSPVNPPKFAFCDYRKMSGRFDHIVSIEMFEAVGREYWDEYFSTLANLLDKGGSAVLQIITILEERFDDYCKRPDFIQKYIFPGGMLPTREQLNELASKHGFEVRHTESFGLSYARTLRDWRDRFDSSLGEVKLQGFDDSFIRMWRYYLTYCEAGFTTGTTDVGLWKLVKR